MSGYVIRPLPSVTATAVTDGGATEKVVATLANVSTPGPEAEVNLFGHVNITTGTAATAVVVKVRRGTDTSGTEVGTAETDTLAAGNKESIPFNVVDTPGDIAGESYVVTVTETSATADGTVNYAYMGGYID